MIRSIMLTTCLLLLHSVSTGQDSGATQSPKLALDRSTVAVLSVDLSKISSEELENWVRKQHLERLSDKDITTLFSHATQQLDALRSSGTEHLDFSWRTSDLIDGIPLVQAPTQDPKVFDQVLSKCWEFFLRNGEHDMKASSGWATFGQKADVALVTADAFQGTSRFDAALAHRLLDHQLIINLPAESREDLIALWPQELVAGSLPIKLSPQQLVRDVEAIDLQWSMPPKSEVRVALTASSEAAADRLAEQTQTLLDLGEQWKSAFRVNVDNGSVVIEPTGNPDSPAFAILLAEISKEVSRQRQQTQRLQTMSKMKQIGLALHQYHDANSHFPLPAIKNADGKELLSWRVAIAPFLEQRAMYNAIDKQQAWDSKVNEIFTQTIIPNYETPGVAGAMTAIRLPSIKGSMWDGTHENPQFRDITDGTSNTIAAAIAPVDQAVPWTKPEVWQLDENDLMGSFFGDRDEVIVISFDGSAITLRKAHMSNERLRGLLTIAGGELSDW